MFIVIGWVFTTLFVSFIVIGDDNSYVPADMLVNNEKWSLKEKSSIIKNQSAATFLSILTNSDDYGRGFHLLNELAPERNPWRTYHYFLERKCQYHYHP